MHLKEKIRDKCVQKYRQKSGRRVYTVNEHPTSSIFPASHTAFRSCLHVYFSYYSAF